MSLSISDLKAIRKIVKDEVNPVKKDISSLKKGQSSLKTDVSSLKKGQKRLETGQKRLEEGQKRLEKKLDYSIDFLDKEHLKLKNKVELYHPAS